VRRHEFERDLFGDGVQHFEGFDAGIEAPGLKQVAHEFRIGAVMRRTHVVRLRCHPFEPRAHLTRIETGVEARFQSEFGRRVGSGKP
jgi:hypothetical protein